MPLQKVEFGKLSISTAAESCVRETSEFSLSGNFGFWPLLKVLFLLNKINMLRKNNIMYLLKIIIYSY